MSLNCGIVGLPNVGKSTIFSALSSAPAQIANYPFCTIDSNVGVVDVPDSRLDAIARLIPSKRTVPATFKFVDIAGLVAGASKGEGLGNQFLAHIREVGVVAHVVRCFDDPDIVHTGPIDPLGDIETINTELALADLETVERRIEKTRKLSRASKEAAKEAAALLPVLERLQEGLGKGERAFLLGLDDDQKALVVDLQLLTLKPVIYVCNIAEDAIGADDGAYVRTVKEFAAKEGAETIVVCGKIEAEIASLETAEERREFLEAAGLEESALGALIRTAYKTLGLRTFFTIGADENRAWTFKEGMKAPATAGLVHTDFEKGFIKAEVYSCGDLFELGSEQKVREAGRLRIEGKEYAVQDGDVVYFRFNL